MVADLEDFSKFASKSFNCFVTFLNKLEPSSSPLAGFDSFLGWLVFLGSLPNPKSSCPKPRLFIMEAKTEKSTTESLGDPFHLSGSDHPGMQLTLKAFNGSNYVGWSKSARMALEAKSKLGFIDGSIAKPTQDSPELTKWTHCDYMVRSWILNSLTPDISVSFSAPPVSLTCLQHYI